MVAAVMGMTAIDWVLWSAILVGISIRGLNMWAYGPGASWLHRFRHDRPAFRILLPLSGLVIGCLAWSWGTYGSAAGNLVLAVAALFPSFVRRRRWLAALLGHPAGMGLAFVAVPSAIVLAWPDASPAARVQVAGGYQLIVGFLAVLAGAWDGERSADTWRWLAVCLSVDVMLGVGALALAATPIIALEAMALAMDLTKLGRKLGERSRSERLVLSPALAPSGPRSGRVMPPAAPPELVALDAGAVRRPVVVRRPVPAG